MPAHFVGLSGFASPAVRPSLRAESYSASELLARYALAHDSVEMDSAFTRFPTADTIQTWCDSTSESFSFSVRMSRDVTHRRGLRARDELARALGVLEPLGSRLACVVFTTPSVMRCDVDSLRGALEAVPAGVRTAWEFLHDSWICPEVLDLLVDHGSAPLLVDRGDNGGELIRDGSWAQKWELPFVYVRLRRERYLVRDIFGWSDVLSGALARGADVFAFFRQSTESSAYATALGELLCRV